MIILTTTDCKILYLYFCGQKTDDVKTIELITINI
jgi:hypothetical protein